MTEDTPLYGMMAEFVDEHRFLAAVRQISAAGYTRTEAYSPFPVEGVAEALHFRRTWLPLLVLVGGVIGLVSGYLLQYWASAIAYPLNVGGRPLNSWPMFVPITYELTILFAAFAALFGMLILNRLPEPYHPVFNVPEFARASQDRFFIVVEAADARFDLEATRRLLEDQGARKVYDVPA